MKRGDEATVSRCGRLPPNARAARPVIRFLGACSAEAHRLHGIPSPNHVKGSCSRICRGPGRCASTDRVHIPQMTAPDLPLNEAPHTTARAYALLLAVFASAIFVSAALLFAVQPMFTKMVLPRLGGAPAVWSVAIVFFQARAAGRLRLRPSADALCCRAAASVIVHLAVMVAACFTLPLSIASGWGTPARGRRGVLADRPVRGLDRPAVLRALRQWPAAAGVVRAHRPPGRRTTPTSSMRRAMSAASWRCCPIRCWSSRSSGSATRPGCGRSGSVVLIALIAGCGVLLWRSPASAAGTAADGDAAEAAPPTWRDAATWVALAAVPSGLLVAVTAHISTDVAAVPLLWVLPLALYLLTFVIVFARRPIIPHWLVGRCPAALHHRPRRASSCSIRSRPSSG